MLRYCSIASATTNDDGSFLDFGQHFDFRSVDTLIEAKIALCWHKMKSIQGSTTSPMKHAEIVVQMLLAL